MARLAVRGEELIVELTWWEKITARHTDVRVPLAAVEKVTVERDWRRAVRGEPSRGVWIGDLLHLGVRNVSEQAEVRDFVAIRPRRGPVARVDLRPAASPFARVAVSDRVPQATAATVRTAVSHHLLAPAGSGCADPAPAPRRRPAWLPGRSPAPAPPAGI
ncbi:hypothetical protein ACWGH4_29335 [Streptomyces sp. NPDC054847]